MGLPGHRRTSSDKRRRAAQHGLKATNPAVCPKCGKTTRVAYTIVKGEGKKDKKFRACKKCKEIIE